MLYHQKINKLLDLYVTDVEVPLWIPFNFQYCPFNHNWLDETDQEDKYCYWFSRVTNTFGSLQTCINSVASYKGEFIANKNALLNVVKKHKSVLLDMINKLSLEDTPLEIYHMERLWYPLFLGHTYKKCNITHPDPLVFGDGDLVWS